MGLKLPQTELVPPQATAGSTAAAFSHPHFPKENRNSERSGFSTGGKTAGVEHLGKLKGEHGTAGPPLCFSSLFFLIK